MVSVIVSAGRTDKYSTLRLLSVQIHTDIRTLRVSSMGGTFVPWYFRSL